MFINWHRPDRRQHRCMPNTGLSRLSLARLAVFLFTLLLSSQAMAGSHVATKLSVHAPHQMLVATVWPSHRLSDASDSPITPDDQRRLSHLYAPEPKADAVLLGDDVDAQKFTAKIFETGNQGNEYQQPPLAHEGKAEDNNREKKKGIEHFLKAEAIKIEFFNSDWADRETMPDPSWQDSDIELTEEELQRMRSYAFLWLMLGTAGVIGYLVWIWDLMGRDPISSPVIPRWEPPTGVSPAMASWLKSLRENWLFNPYRALAVSLMSLATKGQIRFYRMTNGILAVLPTPNPFQTTTGEEHLIMDAIDPKKPLFLDRMHGHNIEHLISVLHKFLKMDYETRFVARNRLWWGIGFVLGLIVLLVEREQSGLTP